MAKMFPSLAVTWLMFAAVILTAASAAETSSSSSLLDAAGDLVARALSSSNVLTLNLTNVIILVILKVIIFVGGLFVLNSTSGSTYSSGLSGLFGRREDGDSTNSVDTDRPSAAITTTDLRGGMCFLLYTSGAEDRLGCLLQAACLDPQTADSYLVAAKYWQQAHQFLKT